MLLGWPQKGPLWTRAVQACVDAMEGKVTPDVAREPSVRLLRRKGCTCGILR
ncbi:DUF982 domain-containing protein [Mesorhizobium sp. M2A.F.Ca.ET.042.01.1.1]|uniref:DUF982 domain-containing protein n=1 Tax=Mesorhizobium sp. M2A.F.Ca.ET.042.01.1.1 TaxID=2496745 RepID=UPI001FE20343|nr:DUF982 domain-containing protein [Mesorhizobium sp. M2A.F.Ca.ET.042.01.1.1]